MGCLYRYLVIWHCGKCMNNSSTFIHCSMYHCLLYVQLIFLLWGENWFIFAPGVAVSNQEYELKILMKMYQFFGPFPASYTEIADNETLAILTYIMNSVPDAERKPFQNVGEREISKEDKAFILKIMKLDPRDRPTAKELLQDEWFTSA